MTLQSSGSMTIADINTELGRASGAELSTDDAALMELAFKESGDPITIPDDLYGKTHLGALYGTYTVTVSEVSSGVYGFFISGGSVSPTTYRGNNVHGILAYSTGGTYDAYFGVAATVAQSQVTGIRFVDEGADYLLEDFTSSDGFSNWYFGDGTAGLWGPSDVGSTKTVKVYGS